MHACTHCYIACIVNSTDHQQSKPELKELVHYSDRIVTCWKQLALELSLSAEEVNIINYQSC